MLFFRKISSQIRKCFIWKGKYRVAVETKVKGAELSGDVSEHYDVFIILIVIVSMFIYYTSRMYPSLLTGRLLAILLNSVCTHHNRLNSNFYVTIFTLIHPASQLSGKLKASFPGKPLELKKNIHVTIVCRKFHSKYPWWASFCDKTTIYPLFWSLADKTWASSVQTTAISNG